MNVGIPSVLASYTGGARRVAAEGDSVAALLADLDRQFPGLRFRMVDERGRLRRHVRVFVNGEAIRDLDVAVREADDVQILQALSGG